METVPQSDQSPLPGVPLGPQLSGHSLVDLRSLAFDRLTVEKLRQNPAFVARGLEATAAQVNPFRFSTKYTDDESGLVYYGYRYYNAD